VIKIKPALLIVISIIFLSSIAISIAKFEIISPRDKVRTLSTRVTIDGTAAGAQAVDINGTKVKLEKGSRLYAVALLRPGKNVVLITAKYPGEEKLTKKIRVLRIVTCDDVEKLFKGRQHWAKQQVLTLLTLGIIEGYPDNMFLPGRPLSRGEFATWLARAKQLKKPKLEEDVFFDVPKEHWRASFIKAVVDEGYMSGVTGEIFEINRNINRKDAVVAIAKASKLIPTRLNRSPFSDVPPDLPDSAYIFSAYNKGWVIGYPGKVRSFEPEKDMTRGEIAVLLSRLTNIINLKTALYDFEKGYTVFQFSKISTKPEINKVAAEPSKIAADGKTPLKLSADVTDAQGKADISQVWTDITSLGGPNNAKMNLMASGFYEITFIMTTETVPGEKNITVKALDKSGLRSEKSVKITVIKEKQ
jgi:hypothetical protein